MGKKNCINCYFFDSDIKHEYGGWKCGLHTYQDRKVKITYPSQQFCGDEYWISNKKKLREEKLQKLGM